MALWIGLRCGLAECSTSQGRSGVSGATSGISVESCDFGFNLSIFDL